jgi:hypothetical protein
MKSAKKNTSSGTVSFLNGMDVGRWQMTSAKLSLSYQARREVLASFLLHYRAASSAQKSLLLDSFVRMTGYARTSAIRLLNHPPEGTGLVSRCMDPRCSRRCFWPGERPAPSVSNA